MAFLEIRDLRVVYENGTEALKSVSFTAEHDQIVAIIGRSGAGKSTLLRTINGLQPVTAGSVVLDGDDIAKMRGKDIIKMRRHVGFVWQEYNLVDRLPVMTNVLCGRLGYNEPWKSAIRFFSPEHRAIAIKNLERVNLLHKASHRADQCSGGEKQRISVARALTQEPKILLADEPVASLDPELAVQVLADLARVAREVGVLTLINIHQVELAKRFCERIIGIAQGEVVFDGTPDQLDENALDRIYRFDKVTASPTPESETTNILPVEPVLA